MPVLRQFLSKASDNLPRGANEEASGTTCDLGYTFHSLSDYSEQLRRSKVPWTWAKDGNPESSAQKGDRL